MNMFPANRLAPILLFVALVISTLRSELDHKTLYIVASAVVITGTFLVIVRLINRTPDA